MTSTASTGAFADARRARGFRRRPGDHRRPLDAVQVPAGAQRDGADAPRPPGQARAARPLRDLAGDGLRPADPAVARGVRRCWRARLPSAASPGIRGARCASSTRPADRDAARRRRDALRPLPRRSRPSRPRRRARVGDDGRRLDPGQPADARDVLRRRLRDRRRRRGRHAARRRVRRGAGGRRRGAHRRRDQGRDAATPSTAAAASATWRWATARSRSSTSPSSATSASASWSGHPRPTWPTRPSSARAGSGAGSAATGPLLPPGSTRGGRRSAPPMAATEAARRLARRRPPCENTPLGLGNGWRTGSF